MPGFNQRGPMNDGPMTGRRQGRCTDTFGPGQSFSREMETNNMGRRCRRQGFQARGRGYNQEISNGKPLFTNEKDNLQNHADMLEKELMAVKRQIKNFDETDE